MSIYDELEKARARSISYAIQARKQRARAEMWKHRAEVWRAQAEAKDRALRLLAAEVADAPQRDRRRTAA